MFKKFLICILVFVILISSISPIKVKAVAAGKDMTWKKITKETQSNNLYDITYNKTKTYVTVGDDGMILISKDGNTWGVVSIHTAENLNAVTTDGKKFVAVGNNGTILHSSNGKTWTSGKISLSYNYKQASGDYYKIVDEYYNIKWSTKAKASQLQFKNVLWDGKKYIGTARWSVSTGSRKANAYGHGEKVQLSGTIIVTSKDGMKWTAKYADIPDVEKIIYTGSQYISTSTNTVSISKDLQSWKTIDPKIRGEFTNIIYTNGKYVATTWDGNISARTGGIYTSSDAIKWKEIINKKEIGSGDSTGIKGKYGKANGFYDLIMNHIMWDGKQYIISGLSGMLITSKDAKTWNMHTKLWNVFFQPFVYDSYISSGKKANIKKTIYDGTQYIMIGDNGTICTSTNLKSGNVVRSRVGVDFTSITYDGKSRYLAHGMQGSLWESSNGYDFGPVDLPEISGDYSWNGVVAHKGIVIAPFQSSIGWSYADSEYLYSNKPGEWKRMKFPKEFRTVYYVTHLNNKFYAFTTSGIINSKDGVKWSDFTSEKTLIKYAAYNGKTFVGQNTFKNVYGSSEEALHYSKDGTKWNKIIIKSGGKKYNISANKLIWNGKQFVTVGGYIYTEDNSSMREKMIGVSADGVNWKIHKKDIPQFYDGVYGGGKYITVDEAGLVYYSTNGLDYSKSKVSTTQSISTVLWDGNRFLAGGKSGVILTTTIKNKTIPPQSIWVDELESYAITEDGYTTIVTPSPTQTPTPIVIPDVKAENEEVLIKKRIDVVKKIAKKYNYTVSEYVNENKDNIRCVFDNTEDKFGYNNSKNSDYKNTIYFNIVDSLMEKSINTSSEIIALHTDLPISEIKNLINDIITENKEGEEKVIINEIEISYRYLHIGQNIYQLSLQY